MVTIVTLLDFELNVVGTWALPDDSPPPELRRPAYHHRPWPMESDDDYPLTIEEEVYEYVGFNTYRRRR